MRSKPTSIETTQKEDKTKKLNLCLSILLLMLSVSVIFSGCSSDSSKIDMVKDGTLNFDETKTINDVFKNNQLLGNQEWEYFEAKDGSQVVQFKADLSHEKLNSSFKEILAEVEKNPLALLGLSGGSESGMIGMGMIFKSNYQFKKCAFVQQFLLSKAKTNEFKIGNSTINYQATRPGNNGEVLESNGSFDDDDNTIIQNLYEDKPAGASIFLMAKIFAADTAKQINKSLQN